MQKTQENEEQWRRKQEILIAELASLQTQVEQLEKNRDKLQEDNSLTSQRIADKKRQLKDIGRIEEEMTPFLEQLALKLRELPEKDTPFLLPERRNRIEKLDKILHDPDIGLSEKYRKTMEALQIEAEFGVTIETYQEVIVLDDQKKLVNILRLGRLGLYFITFDQKDCGFYNIAEQDWQLLPAQYTRSLQTAIEIVDKRRPVEFINMPLGRMVKR